MAREREPEAVSESQGWSLVGGRLMSSQGRWDWGAGAGAGQRSSEDAYKRENRKNKLAVRLELRGGYGYGYGYGYGSMIVPRANSQFQGPRDCGVRAGGKACGKKKKP